MRWTILMLTTVVLGACAGPIGLPNTPIASAPSREPSSSDRAAPTATASSALRADLPDLGAAPELNNEVWLNTDRPLRLADLRGKVVLIDMWTFG